MIHKAKISIRARNEIRRLRAEGMSLEDLAARYDVGTSTIARHVADIPPPATGWKMGGRPRRINYARAVQMRAEGFTLKEIGERYGVTQAAVHYAINYAIRNGEVAA